MRDSDYYLARRKSLFPFIATILIVHFVFAFATFFIMNFFSLFLRPSAAQTAGSVVSIILFVAMMYTESWRAGKQDHNLMNFGHMEEDRFRGLKSALFSQIPGVLLAVLAMINRMTDILPAFFLSAFKLFYAPFVDLIWLCQESAPLLFVLFTLITPVLVHIGYTLGFKGLMISEKFRQHDKKKENIDRDRRFK
jgi:uncharacterized membrane protein